MPARPPALKALDSPAERTRIGALGEVRMDGHRRLAIAGLCLALLRPRRCRRGRSLALQVRTTAGPVRGLVRRCTECAIVCRQQNFCRCRAKRSPADIQASTVTASRPRRRRSILCSLCSPPNRRRLPCQGGVARSAQDGWHRHYTGVATGGLAAAVSVHCRTALAEQWRNAQAYGALSGSCSTNHPGHCPCGRRGPPVVRMAAAPWADRPGHAAV